MVFLKKYNDVVFDIILGVSGSGPTAVFGTSKQSHLTYYTWRNELSTKLMINGFKIHIDYLVDKIIKDCGFDFETFYSSETECLVSAINAKTGEVRYFSNKDEHLLRNKEDIYEVLRASASIPILNKWRPEVKIGDFDYCDCIKTSSYKSGLKKAVEMGATKVLVVDHDPQENRLIDRERIFFDGWLMLKGSDFRKGYREFEKSVDNYTVPKNVNILKIDLPLWSSATTLGNRRETLREVVMDGFRIASFNPSLFRFFHGKLF
jgi:predicted patatin/cPLA2 family phospholipase